MKNIIVNLTVGAHKDVAADYAISVADVFGAHVTGVAFAYMPVISVPVPSAMAGILEAQRLEAEESACADAARFEAAAHRVEVSADARKLTATPADALNLFSRLARRFDLSVVRQAEPGKMGVADLIIEVALFDSGHPVIVVPYIHKAGFKLDRVLVCWDASRAAARAFSDAMPLLARAKAVELIVVATGPSKSNELPGADLAENLARHGVNIELKQIHANGIGVSNAILNHASDVSADLIVMGGYGHSRMREFILGGTTRAMLDSMTVPTLMSH